ncbi:pyruvate dehydrogenase [Sclerotinia borealis F-4128]|uniref:Pyruvate dehydrogenase n=1 Tax=Sclerotinia borealis (strain F-4128) TaxID=1432307 RepID=W9CNQ3_SCLBF|nr:pyruvate dehydrogenase [Sclerotinia borealis F-4128]
MSTMPILRTARLRISCISQIQNRLYTQLKSSTVRANAAKRLGYVSIAGVITVSGIWFSIAGFDDVPRFEESLPKLSTAARSDASKAEVTRRLSQAAYSHKVWRIAGVDRYDGAQLASNSPCEDRFIHGRHASPWNDDDSAWMAWAVFDGHAGWQTADLLEKQLLSIAERVQPLPEKMQQIAPGFAGSCALLSLYDPTTRRLHVACTGDSRAVLGQLDADGSWKAVPLSIDQTGKNGEEIARLRREHPGEEEDIINNGRVLGLGVSRTFGDGQWKWPMELQRDFSKRFMGPGFLTPKYKYETPPYITAEPVVTTTKIEPEKVYFLILATDGLWESVSSQESVDLVATWLQTTSQGSERKTKIAEPTYGPFDFTEWWNGTTWAFMKERTIVQDSNAAVHLVRNSLGGNHHEMIAGRLAIDSPFSRRLRDDITVQVVFFNGVTDAIKK